MEKTVFQKIIDREIPASIVYEDDKFLAFLDINPVTKGHTLLLTKEPFVWIQDVPKELLSEIFIKAQEVVNVLIKEMPCDYVQVVVEGIQVPHFHIHLIPSKNGKENASWNHVSYADDEQNLYAEKIKMAIADHYKNL